MNRSTAYRLIGLLSTSGYIPTHLHGRQKISAEKAFLITVWYLGNLETFRQISDRFNVTYSSAHYCSKRAIKFLLSLKHQMILWPNANRAAAITNGFKCKQGFEDVIGAIDGSHIEIPKPKKDQQAYINRKGYHSLILEGVVDHDKKFLKVFCGEPGSLHDARLLRKSALYKKITNDPAFVGQNFLLGDSAYPNLNWLVTPFIDNGRLTKNQRIFNYKHSATRVIVENAVGLLKQRFRRLKKLDNIDLSFCAHLIMVACILHNLCIGMNDLLEGDFTHDFNQPDELPLVTIATTYNQASRQQEVFDKMFP